jgi:hypothetical protein
MRRPLDDAAQVHRACLARVLGVADVVLLQLARAEARDVEPAVVDGEVDVGDERRHRAEGLERRRELGGVGGLGGDRDRLLRRPLVALAAPEPHRGGEVLDADHDADEAPRLARVVGGPQLEHHLVLVAEIDPLHELALGEAPEVEVVAEAPPEQVLGVQAALDHRGRAPLGGDRDVVAEVPPDVVAEVHVAPVLLPGADHLEGVVVDERHAARAVGAVRASEVGHEDAAGPAVHGVRAGVAGLRGQLLRLDRAHEPRAARIVLRVEDERARRAQSGDDEVAPLEVTVVVLAMALVAEGARARVPAEVVYLVAGGREVGPADDLPVRAGLGIAVDDGHGVRPLACWVERGDVRQLLRRRRDRVGRRAVEGRVGHRDLPSGRGGVLRSCYPK